MNAPKFETQALVKMRTSGGTWFAYQNIDLGSACANDLRSMKCGVGCTFATPPKSMPGLGWRYHLVGRVNLENGTIEPYDNDRKNSQSSQIA